MSVKKTHRYKSTTKWTGMGANGTLNYTSYERSHLIRIENKKDIEASSDPAFRGDATKHNPEELLLASLSSCHMLWYLHLCSQAGVIILDYVDDAIGTMEEQENGAGQFVEVTLQPTVWVKDSSMIEQAEALHEQANAFCFIANSVNFPVKHKVTINVP